MAGDGERLSLTAPAAAWLFLGPAADMPVTEQQWAQLATNPMIYSEQSEWLRRQATASRMRSCIFSARAGRRTNRHCL